MCIGWVVSDWLLVFSQHVRFVGTRYSNRDVYSGKWQADQRSGRGTCVYGNGGRYEGLWAKDKHHGEVCNAPDADAWPGGREKAHS